MEHHPPISRAQLTSARRLVIKVGSSSLADQAGRLDPARLGHLVDAVATHIKAGHQVVLVSSGAQAAGIEPLGLNRQPRDLAQAQAAASVGQGRLMAHYTTAFAHHGLQVGQVLLTAEDVVRRTHYQNALRVLGELLHRSIVPIVNENDAVATDEIKFGDNDRLAALVAHLVRADGLVLLTDVDGLYSAPPNHPGAQLMTEVTNFDQLDAVEVTGRGSAVGTGGMLTKVQAAAMATSSGIPVLLTSAAQATKALAGETVGTFFQATGRPITARRMWLGYAAKMNGRITVDQGAARAITDGKRSLLPVGVISVEGQFSAGDPIEIADAAGTVLARGLAGHSVQELDRIKGWDLSTIETELGEDQAVPAVHRDEMVTQARSRRPKK
ncbi:MAG: glutamate 5-kinase [Micrococcales bacterium]|nr:glutamate 5-kinase [Micrococcales bacterium]